jgi:hypothetical protein
MPVARVANPLVCSDEAGASTLEDGELRVFRQARASLIVPDNSRFCRELGIFTVCSRDEGKLADLHPPAPAVIPINSRVPAGSALGLLGLGWGGIDHRGIWTDSRSATLIGSLIEPIGGLPRLTVWGQVIAPKPNDTQQISVFINDRLIATWWVKEFELTKLYADIPHDIDLTELIKIRFTIDMPVRPIERQMNNDLRQLGLWLHALQIGQAP